MYVRHMAISLCRNLALRRRVANFSERRLAEVQRQKNNLLRDWVNETSFVAGLASYIREVFGSVC